MTMKRNKLYIKEYIELHNQNYNYNSIIDKIIHHISVIENIDPNELYNIDDEDELLERYKKISWIYKPINDSESKEKIEEHKLIPFTHLSLGEFIDLESYISSDFTQNIPKICSVLWREYEKKYHKIYEYDDYDTLNIDERSNYIKNNFYINDVMGHINSYLKFRENLFNSYSIFNTSNEEEDIDFENLSKEERKIVLEELKKKEERRKNGNIWLDILYRLSDGDITKFDDILSINIFMVLNTLQMKIRENS